MKWTKADKQHAQEVIREFLASKHVKRVASGVARLEDLHDVLFDHCCEVQYPTPPLSVFRELLAAEGVRTVEGDPSRYAGVALADESRVASSANDTRPSPADLAWAKARKATKAAGPAPAPPVPGPTPAAVVAIKQWIITERDCPLLTSHVVLGEPLKPEAVAAFRAELDALEASLAKRRNTKNSGTAPRLVEAYAALGVPFLSNWEQTEIDVLAGLAAGRYDSLEAFRGGPGPWSLMSDELWFLVMHGGDEGVAKAKPLLLAAADVAASKGYAAAAAYDRWLATGELGAAAREALTARFSSARAALVPRPVKTAEKLDRQIGAFLKGELARDVVEKSFQLWFGYCYHEESASNFGSKVAHILAHNLFFAPGPPATTLALVKASLAPFKSTRVAKRRVHVLDVEPIAATVAFYRARAEMPREPA